MSSPAKRLLRRVVEPSLRQVGYRLVRVPPPQAVGGYDPTHHDERRPLPPGAAEYLRADNPRLAELRARYGALDWAVCARSRWGEVLGEDYLNLSWFRGDNPYVWQYRQDGASELKYFVFLRYVLDRDPAGLVTSLGEDAMFGCWTFAFEGYPPCSRDLLDSVNELYFLDRHVSLLSSPGLRILDIGAGYGRMAVRTVDAVPGLADYCCVDAVPESTFLCEYFTSFRDVCPPARVVPLPDVPELRPGDFDLALNIHSFSECPVAAIGWWLAELERLNVPRLFVVPNEPVGFLSTESDGSRLDYLGLIEAAGYRLVAEEPVFADAAVRDLLDVRDRFCLFERP